MKRLISYLFAVVALASCMDADRDLNGVDLLPPALEIMEPAVASGSLEVVFTARLEGGIRNEECGFYLSQDESFATNEKISSSYVNNDSGRFTVSKVLRNYGGRWYCKAYSSNGRIEIQSAVVSYDVKPFDNYVKVGVPTVVSSVNGIAVLNFDITFAEDIALTECGLCYGTSLNDLTVNSGFIRASANSGFHSVTLRGLTSGQTYYARSFAREGTNIVYGTSCGFVISSAPNVMTSAPTGIEAQTAVCGGYGIVANGSAITDKGVVWSTTHQPDINSSSHVSAGAGPDAFTCPISGLSPLTTYYVRAYARNGVAVSYGEEMTFTTKAIAVTGVSLSKTSLTMTEGDTQTLTATITPSNASNKNVTWTSSNSTVASVDASGNVTALKAGTATITVRTSDGGYTSQCSITVNAKVYPVTGISLSKTSLTMTEGDTQTLTATITPSNASNKNVTWTSSNSSVASVDANGNVTALKAGTSTITVRTNDGGYTSQCSITVNAKVYPVTGVSLSKTSLTMTEGDTQTLTATITPSNASNKSVSWTSSNSTVASVDANGKVTALKAGTATITVRTSDGGYTSQCSITVNAKVYPVTGISLSKTSLTMTEGDTQTLTATITPSNASNKSVSWTSSNSSVASVDASGNVTALKAGTATITVRTSDGGYTSQCSITVNAKVYPVTGVSLSKTSLTMTEGDTQTLTATITPSNASNKSVSWTSSNSTVASVDASGKVTALKAGTATITVRTNDGGYSRSCTVTVNPKGSTENVGKTDYNW